MPKVSIILPCYNVEEYLAKSIQSVLAQTYIDFELLVIIDGSPDNSKVIAESFSDARVCVYEKPNGGLSDARNYGLDRATGEFIYFMDSDDWIEPTLLAETIPILEVENLDLVIFGYTQEDENELGEIVLSTPILPENSIFTKENSAPKINSTVLGLLGYAWNKVYRRVFLLKHNIRFEKGTSLVEDILFNSEVYCKIQTLRFIDKPLYHYSNRPITTLIKQYHNDSFQLKLKRNRALHSFLDNWNYPEKTKNRILANSTIQAIRYCIHNLFYYARDLSYNDKLEYVKLMIYHENTLRYIKHYKPINLKDFIYKKLIENKQYKLISIIANRIK